MDYLTQEEWKAFIGSVESVRDRALFTVAYWRGLRASEIGLLELADVDWPRRRIRVRRLKNSYSGEYPLAPDEQKALRPWLKVRGKLIGPLFPSRKGGAVQRGQIFVLMQRYGAAAGLAPAKCHPHILKHSIATHLLDKGLDIVDVKDWLGHRAIKNTMVYAEVTNNRRDGAAKKAYG